MSPPNTYVRAVFLMLFIVTLHKLFFCILLIVSTALLRASKFRKMNLHLKVNLSSKFSLIFVVY